MSTFSVFGMTRNVALAEAKKSTQGTCQHSKNLAHYPPTAKMITTGFGRQFMILTATFHGQRAGWRSP